MASVLDASAILAVLLREPGCQAVGDALNAGATVCTANLAEVATVLIRRGVPIDEAHGTIEELPVRIADLDLDLAMRAAALFPRTRAAGLSLGDRVCLALAQREGLPAVSADRAWVTIAPELGIEIKSFR